MSLYEDKQLLEKFPIIKKMAQAFDQVKKKWVVLIESGDNVAESLDGMPMISKVDSKYILSNVKADEEWSGWEVEVYSGYCESEDHETSSKSEDEGTSSKFTEEEIGSTFEQIPLAKATTDQYFETLLQNFHSVNGATTSGSRHKGGRWISEFCLVIYVKSKRYRFYDPFDLPSSVMVSMPNGPVCVPIDVRVAEFNFF